MSALNQPSNVFETLRPLKEMDATREISRQAHAAIRAGSGLDAIAHSLLLVRGVVKVKLDVLSGLLELRTFEWSGRRPQGPQASVISRVAAGTRTWGDLRIEFELSGLEVETPVRFAQFAGQQIAGMLERLELRQLHRNLTQQVLAHRESLASRKLLQRAAGILAASRNLTEHDAIAEIYDRSRQTNEPPAAIAETIIDGEKAPPRYIRRLPAHLSPRLNRL